MAFKEIKTAFWVPETVGEAVTGVVVEFFNMETVHGTGTYAVIEDQETEETTNVVVGGGLQNLLKYGGHLVRVTYEGEGFNERAKKGRSKNFKKFKLEVDTDFEPVEFKDNTTFGDPFK